MAKQKDSGGCGTLVLFFGILCAIGQYIEENYQKIFISLGIIATIIVAYIIYKRRKKKRSIQLAKEIDKTYKSNIPQPKENNFSKSLTLSQINYSESLLKRAYHLADILNTTTDRQEFYVSFDELNSVLKSLSDFEGLINFYGKLPSVQLKEINDNKQKSIDLLEQRIKGDELAEYNTSIKLEISNTPPNPAIEVDPYFASVGRFIIRKGQVSTEAIQEEFNINFSRIVHILGQLRKVGLIAPGEDPQVGEVLMSAQEFESFLNNTEFVKIITSYSDLNTSKPASIDRIDMYGGKYDYMEGHDFERFCARLLEANGFSNVYVTRESNDQGIDVLAEKLGVKYAVQCKRYSSDVGNKAVQEVFAGKSYYGCHVGVVLTNRYFTQSARELAEKTQVFLWDRDVLEKLIQNANM